MISPNAFKHPNTFGKFRPTEHGSDVG